MKIVYLALAVLGAILPYVFFIGFFSTHGLTMLGFLAGMFANGAAAGITVDATAASIVFWIFMFASRRGKHAPKPYLFMVLNGLIGLACALPAYLYAVERSKGKKGMAAGPAG